MAAMLASLPAHAADGGVDAPVAIEVLSDGSRCVSADDWVKIANRVQQAETDRDARWRLTTPQLVLLSAVAVAVGGGIALGVVGLSGRLK